MVKMETIEEVCLCGGYAKFAYIDEGGIPIVKCEACKDEFEAGEVD